MSDQFKNVFVTIHDSVAAAIGALIADEVLPPGINQSRLVVEPPRDQTHGDMSTNAAMVLAKDADRKPRDLAAAIAEKLRADPLIAKVEVAGPGFINMTLQPSVWRKALRSAILAGPDFGRSDIGKAEPVNVEYVSANPTGPMHVGHCRGAGFGEALGENVGPIPEGLYPGDYLKPVGEALAAEHGRSLSQMREEAWLPIVRAKAIAIMMAEIRQDLAALNVRHDVFFSERSLIEGETNAVAEIVG